MSGHSSSKLAKEIEMPNGWQSLNDSPWCSDLALPALKLKLLILFCSKIATIGQRGFAIVFPLESMLHPVCDEAKAGFPSLLQDASLQGLVEVD